MIIDWHAHVYPPEMARERRWGGVSPLTIDNLLEAHENAGIDRCVVSNTIHYLKNKTHEESLAFLRRWNDYGAEIQQKYKDRIVVFTSTIPCGGEPFLKELERAISQNGLQGVLINSSHQGAYPDDDEAKSFFEMVVALGIPTMMHAPSVGFGEERMRDYRLASSVGRPFDECLSIARMIVRGVFEKYPGMKFVGCHLGGGISEIIGRMDYAYELGDKASGLGGYEPLLITKKPSEYLREISLDTVCYHPPALTCAYQTVGAKQLLFGSDAPPLL
ncbi:MAG: amidohydrolase, partial [Deltaproteobacteria bacterium]|nr:amidohydrolase [Deltaproteobacteria bacterium]